MDFLLFLFCFAALVKEALQLQIIHLSVPTYRVRGQATELGCDYDLGGNILYSVKWYRDNEEFYRFMPKFDPPRHAYKLEGIKVDLSRSSDRVVRLQQLTLKSSGVYRCEVSAEAPSFNSAAAERRMDVIYLPREGPRITEHEENHRGEFLFLNCTSGRSYPAAELSWDIDGEKVTNPELLVEYSLTPHAHGLVSSTLGLRVPRGRSMQVRCTARVAPTWRQGKDAIIDNLPFPSKEAMVLVRSSSGFCTSNVMLLAISTLASFLKKYSTQFHAQLVT